MSILEKDAKYMAKRKREMKMKKWKDALSTFALAILAGNMIGIGGAVYLAADNKVVGALMFTVGLYTICIQQMNLFTGKVGYLPEKKPGYLIDLLIIWCGNLVGTFVDALLLSVTRFQKVGETAKALCEVKLSDGMGSLLVLGIFCGILMFIAVDGYAKTKNPIILFLGVAAFIMCGFEHCVADMFYFSMAGMWSISAFVRVLVISLGNALGGMLIPLVKKLNEASKIK